MEVILADYLGFCYGVKRAIKIARENAAPDGSACTLGPIIHNPQMVERLKEEGVGTIDRLDDLKRGKVIIRSHGVGPETYERAEAMGLECVDATCPHVKKAQLSAKELAEEGRFVVIVGEKEHPEVHSIVQWAGGNVAVIETVAEAAFLPNASRLGIISQTTFSGERFQEIVSALLDKSRDIRVMRTICTATDQRQRVARELASKVDVMLVIGGKNSANTTRLAQLCAKICRTYHIETAEELRPAWFDNIEKIGITAGASTPDWIIKEVYKKCQRI
ncbi:4-hydroxy-3-methylbut-2-enyl diphosphate reductase [uncultured Selenomonas sp.]|uniref:4-hydroxy-3-methylbut-2-enyl diphosphate reductase n=1 Tax=uncultured Selenomonas sp. TaxID=159275 RepID=UPI002804E84E|nr:4-hydroxy-3-methylbut-2-enyl diphosphate reductase [uncultured Selenomonas sp.]